jgi:hypothetical protein
VKPLAGADLSPNVMGLRKRAVLGSDGVPRTGVFFMTNDMITELGHNEDAATKSKYASFLANVNEAINAGSPLVLGPVRQPNNVRALCTGDWKIVRYVDPKGVEPDEWELYCLTTDPIEQTNLVDFMTGEVRDDVSVPGLGKNQLRLKNKQLRRELAWQEVLVFGKDVRSNEAVYKPGRSSAVIQV